MRRRRLHAPLQKMKPRRQHAGGRELSARAGLGRPSRMTEAVLAERTIEAARVGEYLDYLEAVGPDRADAWLAADLRVSDDVALDRIAELVATEAGDTGLAESVAAVVRATGRSAAIARLAS